MVGLFLLLDTLWLHATCMHVVVGPNKYATNKLLFFFPPCSRDQGEQDGGPSTHLLGVDRVLLSIHPAMGGAVTTWLWPGSGMGRNSLGFVSDWRRREDSDDIDME